MLQNHQNATSTILVFHTVHERHSYKVQAWYAAESQCFASMQVVVNTVQYTVIFWFASTTIWYCIYSGWWQAIHSFHIRGLSHMIAMFSPENQWQISGARGANALDTGRGGAAMLADPATTKRKAALASLLRLKLVAWGHFLEQLLEATRCCLSFEGGQHLVAASLQEVVSHG